MKNSVLSKMVVVTLVAFAAVAVRAAYTFTPGEAIPLYGDGADVDYLTDLTNVKVSSDHTFLDGLQGSISARFALENQTAGAYVLEVEGSHEKTDMTLTATISTGRVSCIWLSWPTP